MLLVVGATGMLGSEICRQLASARNPVRALVRRSSDPARVRELQALGIEIVTGDLRDPVSLAAACTGVTGVISAATAVMSHEAGSDVRSVDHEGQLALVAAAEAAGVAHFVYVSMSGRIDIDCALVHAKRAIEDRLRKTGGMTHTILRPTAFMETWLSPAFGFDVLAAHARILGSGRNRVSWVAMADVARFAVAATSHSFMRNVTQEIGGPQALSLLDVVQLCEELGSSPFELEFTDEESLERRWLCEAEEPDRTVAALQLGLARGDAIPMHRLLAFFPFDLCTVRQHVARSMHRYSQEWVIDVVGSYRYVSKNPAPAPLSALPPLRPESLADPFI
jgi:uncharacterized protein YbjT (DUF2867 family)